MSEWFNKENKTPCTARTDQRSPLGGRVTRTPGTNATKTRADKTSFKTKSIVIYFMGDLFFFAYVYFSKIELDAEFLIGTFWDV